MMLYLLKIEVSHVMAEGGSSPSGVAALRPKAAAKRKRAECTKIETQLKWISRGPVSSKQWEIAQKNGRATGNGSG